MSGEVDGAYVLHLTPPGMGAIAVVRIMGDKVDSFLCQHFTVKTRVGRATYGRLVDGDDLIDDPLVARISRNMADINLHGGLWLVQRFIDLAAREGFKQIQTQPTLPAQAVDAADALEREMFVALPSARTEAAVRLVLAQPEAWRGMLNPAIDRERCNRARIDRSLHWMLNPPTVAIVGPPNAGKSTLANQLFGRARSITADVPGTTRDWVGEIADIDGLPVMLIDTPGVRATNDPIEQEAIERATSRIERADLVIVVDEAGRDSLPISQFRSAVRVTNKMDRETGVGINTDAISGEGIDQLRRAIRIKFDFEPINLTKACCWTDRQRQLLDALLVDSLK